jgi:DNA (cytosine-5)-methyltransferase 1
VSRVIEAADLFCGLGGTSTGLMQAIQVLGHTARLVAINHWAVAVATHQANHPAARHLCADIERVRPEEAVPGGKLDLLVASPECVFFSRARGGKPVNDQRRAGAWWLLEWLSRLDVQVLLVENVKEFLLWGDLTEDGRPDKKKLGRIFIAWRNALMELGYTVDWRVLNAADHGDVTTRERLFVQARKDGKPIRWPTPTHSKRGTSDMFGTLPKWRAASEIIDWSDLGPSLLDRPKPLSLKTRLRIARGLQRFGGVLAPYYIRLLDLPEADAAGFGVTAASGPAEPFLAPNTENAVPKSTDEPCGTVTTIPGIYLAVPTAEPFVVSRNGHNDPNGRVRRVADPLATITSSGSGTGYLVSPEAEPFTIANRAHNVPRGVDEPTSTFTTATGGGTYIVSPDASPFVVGQQSDAAARPVEQPIPTVATAGVIRLTTPTVQPFLDVYYQTGQADSVDDPLSTATTKPRHALVAPLVVPYGPKAEARSTEQPLPTVMTKDRLGVATPTVSFLTPGFSERDGQQPRIHSLDAPAPTIAASGHLHLATATIEEAIGEVDPRRLVWIDGVLHLLDIRFRMLKNSELALAMGFPADYQFRGTKSDVTKQIGNAVAVNTARALVLAVLGGEAVERWSA